MICSSCGKENQEEAKYCVYCGAEAGSIAAATVAAPVASPTKPCGSCGKENQEEAKYCVYCGADTDPKKISWWGKFKSSLSF
jgi:uncharacterized membrane protein YvbJ